MSLQQIQTALKAPKGQTNKFGGYKYRSCEDIVEAAKPILAKHKAYLTLSDEMVEVGGRVYVKATATITLSDGNQVSTHGYAREADSKKGMDDSQLTGSCSSYARKYALNGLLAIDDTKDADTMDNRQPDYAKHLLDIQNLLKSKDDHKARLYLEGLDANAKKSIWGLLTQKDQEKISQIMQEKA